MAPTLASALTLSAAAIASKTFLRLTTKSYDVEGLPILLDALREDKGKGRAIDGEEEIGPEPRRGLVTGKAPHVPL